MKPFLEKIQDDVVVFDGAMGTMLYAKGFFINTCYDNVNLTNPGLVQSIHEDYVRAGVDVIETNTYGANAIKLGAYGLADQMREINSKAVAIAKNAVKAAAKTPDACYIAGSMGPIIAPNQIWQPRFEESILKAYADQAAILAENGVDLFILETFTHIEELLAAARAIKSVSSLPLVGSLVPVDMHDENSEEAMLYKMLRLNQSDCIDVAGINCGIGPAVIAEVVERVRPHITKPFLVMPNAGSPQQVDGRTIYLNSPEYFSTYMKRYRQLGSNAVGGCCGTTPEQLAEAVKGLKVEKAIDRKASVIAVKSEVKPAEAVPLAEKSKLGAKLAEGKLVATIELVPPRSCDLGPIIQKAVLCRERGIDAINLPDGPRASSRISSLVTAIEIERQTGIETILHYCCRDRNLISMQSDIMGAYTIGLRNVLAITGDPPKLGEYPNATGVFDVDSVGLTQAISNLNHGLDLGGNALPKPTAMVIGVGLNPCALSFDYELKHYGDKVRSGAEFVITQPVFDPNALFKFLDAAEKLYGKLPVIVGVWPLVSYKNAEFMQNEVPGVEIPGAIMERMSKTTGKEEGIAEGIKIAREMIQVIKPRAAGFQVSAPFGKTELALEVLKEILNT
ncbi:MAG: bifunctional homocysteine S-methyltransferase/methylenetetrahydrofolate reductase [Spirochaetales bacterium]|jgi:homocysteine S-methyltransferase|nr:bifunctional homocysteine S-methyltransferase/methylenetetrahydrofolate reductase [Spirochaetales bacterium]